MLGVKEHAMTAAMVLSCSFTFRKRVRNPFDFHCHSCWRLRLELVTGSHLQSAQHCQQHPHGLQCNSSKAGEDDSQSQRK